jgi:hypothetical protein
MNQLVLLFLLATTAETTILNTSVVKVDRAGRTITVKDAGESAARQLPVAPSAAATLARLRPGNEVLLTLSGASVVDIKLTGTPARRGTQEIPQLPPGARTPANRGVPQLPAGVDAPQGRPIPQVVPSPGIVITRSPSPGISPAGVAPTRPAQSPVAVGSPRSPGTPRPVVLPSDPPPTPIPSPGANP